MSVGSRFSEEFRWFVRETWFGYALVIPTTIVLIAIIGYPMVEGVRMSFYDVSLLARDDWTFVGVQNYVEFFVEDAVFWTAFTNTVILTGVAVALQFLLGVALALLLNEKLPGMSIFRSLTMIPWVMPIIVMVLVFDWMVQPEYGVVNIFFGDVGLPTRYWFGVPAASLPMIILMHVWRNVPFYAIAFLAVLQTIPDELYEAARIDGANAWQRFRHITLPHLSYIAMVMIVLHVIFTFNNFDIVFLATGGGPGRSSEVLATYVYKEAFSSYMLGYAASMGVAMMIILLVFTAIYVKLQGRQ